MNRKQRRTADKPSRKLRQGALAESLGRAVTIHRQGGLAEAEAMYRSILRQLPGQPDALHYLGLILHQQGNSGEGIALIRRALDIVPAYVDAHNNLGNILKETGALEQAKEAYQQVISLEPNHAPALNNLGVVLRSLGDYPSALEALSKATGLAPDNADFWQNLGNVHRKLGDFTRSAEAFRKAIALRPFDAEAYKGLWRTHYMAREHAEAVEVLRQWLRFDPNNPVALHTLAAHTGEGGVPERASDGYVLQTFDKFAGSFDAVLRQLEYRAPDLVAGAVVEVCRESGAGLRILDAGCGTGLCGPLLKPHASELVGVDLSPQMLARAKRREVYTVLVEAELVDYLSRQTAASFDLVVSADTLVYFGDLCPFALAAKRALRAGGHLIFTVEKADAVSDYQLNIHGRYSHSPAYLEKVLQQAGFEVLSSLEVVLRQEAGVPVQGLLVTAKV